MARGTRVGIDELYFAYRKAKHYAFRDPNTAHGFRFAAFEHDLGRRLAALRTRLLAPRVQFDERFIGGWTAVPKWTPTAGSPSHFYASDPYLTWNNRSMDFRTVAAPSVEMQVINALWCMTSGSRLDRALHHAHVYASHPHRGEMRTFRSGLRISCSRPLFQHWPSQYARWQRNGLSRMRTALQEGRRVVAITMDLQKFYHRLDPQLLLSPDFLTAADVPPIRFSETESWLNRILVDAVRAWNLRTNHEIGLPVGWTSSAVLANAALRVLDQRILQNLTPIYYGRYVDDVFLVVEPHRSFKSASEALGWLQTRLPLKAEPDSQATRWRVDVPGLGKSLLTFGEAKQKVFCLDGEAGLDLVRPITEAIRRRSSEFRSLPVLPTDEDRLAASSLLTTTDASIDADAIRKADAITVRRHGFSLALKKANEYREYLDADCWIPQRRAFLAVVRRHLLTPRGVAELSGYLPRVFTLAASTLEWRELRLWVALLNRVQQHISGPPQRESESSRRFWRNLWGQLAEATVAGTQQNHLNRASPIVKDLIRLSGLRPITDLKDVHRKLAEADWLLEPRMRSHPPSPRRRPRWPAHLVTNSLKPLLEKDREPLSGDLVMLATRLPGFVHLAQVDDDDDPVRVVRNATVSAA
jgi:hypothetical protein